nr:MAG TPA: hypothetical protein [Caudoviricetes sp.]
MADKPVTREEKYLAYLTGDYNGELPKPITRKEKYLYELCLKGIGGEISPEEIKAAVNEYLEKNPVKPGATAEQVQQIEQNKTDIGSLKEETGSLKEEIVDLKKKYEMTNYMLFADEYSKKKYINGVLTNMNFWKSTNILKLDKLYDMYSPAVNGIAVFFDKNEEYISDVEFKYNLPVLKASYPANAVYVAFSYQQDYMESYNNMMYVIRTNNYNVRTRSFYPTTKKEVGKRPSIYIYANDTQDEILWKLVDAFLTRDCDVYFESSTYVFDDVFVDLYEKYKYRQYAELPIGGGCRYYFNGSTLIANVDKMREKGYEATIDLLSCIESLNAI